MSNLPSVTLLKDRANIAYYDYVGKVVMRRARVGLENYVVIVDRKTGEDLCQIDVDNTSLFLKHKGKVVKFRGKLDKYHGLVTPHVK